MLRCSLLMLACLMLPLQGAAQPGAPRVLSIFFGQRDTPYEILLEDGLRRGFDDSAGRPRIQLDPLYLDMTGHYQPAQAKLLSKALRLKFGEEPPFDAIILNGLSARRFHKEYGTWLSRGPVIQIEGDFIDPPLDDAPNHYTLRHTLAIAEAAETAVRMRPDTRALWVIAGTGRGDMAVLEAARAQLAALSTRVTLRFIEVEDADALLEDIGRTPPGTLLLYLRATRDGTGRRIIPAAFGERIGQRANAPMFCIYETILRHSRCVGGSVSIGRHTGETVAAFTRQVLQGDTPDSSAQRLPTRQRYQWPQLQRWHIRRVSVPASAELIDYTPTLYERYTAQVWGTVAALAVLTATLLGLMWAMGLYRKQRDTLAEIEQRWHLALDSAGQGVWDLDVRRGTTYYAPGWQAMLGLSTVTDDPKLWEGRIHPTDRPRVMSLLQQHLSGRTPHFESDHRMIRADDSTIWVRERGQVVHRSKAGKPLRFIATMQDITEQRLAQEHVRHMATHDTLTGLPNRTLLSDRLDRAITRARRMKHRVAVIFLDLDHFKTVNDTLGHPVGDLLLIAVAGRMMPHLRETDTISRQGGDEFVILLPELHSAADAAQVCDKLQREMDEPVALDGRSLRISVSMGVAMFPDDGETVETLLQKADVALYQVKNSGRGDYRFFSADMNREMENQFDLESRMGAALNDGRIRLWYQPQFDLTSGQLIGAEALARWIEPDGTAIPPDAFIPVAEKFGHIQRLGELALHAACAEAVGWAHILGRPIPVSVNLSSVQFRRPGLTEQVRRILNDTGLAAAQLVIEITESVLMEDNITTRETLAGLATLGVALSVDDFGTGYSSLAYLKRFPVNHLKIDRAFVADLGCDPDSDTIVRTIVQLGHNLGLQVIAEGVETTAQQARLRGYGCDIGQGYLYHPALPPERFLQLLRQS